MSKNELPNIEETFKISNPNIVVIKQYSSDEFYVQSYDIVVIQTILDRELPIFRATTYSKNEIVYVYATFFGPYLCMRIMERLERRNVPYSLIDMDNIRSKYFVVEEKLNQYSKYLPLQTAEKHDFYHKKRDLYNPECKVTSPRKIRIGTKKNRV